MTPSPELGLDLVRYEPSWQHLPSWDPRLWQRVEDVARCQGQEHRDTRTLNEAGLNWARHHLARRKDERNQLDDLAQTLKQGTVGPSRGRPQLARTDAGEGRDARRPQAEHGTGRAGREVGLAYFGARYLSLGLGRWMSPDPVTIHEMGSDLNPYAYVNGRPLVSVDPNGEFAFLISIAIGFAIGAAINATQQAIAGGPFNWGSFLAAGATGAVAGGLGPLAGGLGGALALGAGTGALGFGLDVWWGGNQFSWGGLALSAGIGAAAGAAGYGIGKLLAGKGSAAGPKGEGVDDVAGEVGNAAGPNTGPPANMTTIEGRVVKDPLEMLQAEVPDAPPAQAPSPKPTPKPAPKPATPAPGSTSPKGPVATEVRPPKAPESNLGLPCREMNCTVRAAGKGSTADLSKGTTVPRNLREAMAVKQAMADPKAGTQLRNIKMTDPRWRAEEGWVKMQLRTTPGGEPINVHYLYNTVTGAVDDFKIVLPGAR